MDSAGEGLLTGGANIMRGTAVSAMALELRQRIEQRMVTQAECGRKEFDMLKAQAIHDVR
jgi:hypothetical protein